MILQMSNECCELCGNKSIRFTCQMCITTGNFWVDKAKFSFSGKKQMVTKLLTEKLDMQNHVAKVYSLSIEAKESISKSIQNEILSLHERIKQNKSQSNIFHNQICDVKKIIRKHHIMVDQKRKSIENYKKCLEDEHSQISKSQTLLIDAKTMLQKQCHIVLRTLNRRIFRINESSNEVKFILNIPFSECKNASEYVKQIKINSHDDISHNLVLSYHCLFNFVMFCHSY